MKTIKQLCAAFLLIVFVAGMAELSEASSIGGIPFNPTFGTVTATTINTSGTETAHTLVATSGSKTLTLLGGTSNGSILDTGGLGINASGGCLFFSNQTISSAPLLPCTGATVASNSVFTAVTGSNTVVDGETYAFNLTMNGTTCVVASNSPPFPSGWSAASSGAGICTLTFPSITLAAKMIPVAMGQSLYCDSSAATTQTTVKITCFTIGTSTAANGSFYITLQDWN